MMTVKELKESLQDIPDDWNISANGNWTGKQYFAQFTSQPFKNEYDEGYLVFFKEGLTTR